MNTRLRWTGAEIVNAAHGHSLQEQTWQAHGVAIDSRTAEKDDLFVALQGPYHDAHDYVSAAFAAGCSAAIVTRQPSQVPAGSPLVFVDDTFKALERLGQAGRQRATARIVAVTGSVGKTSSKEMLHLMLKAVGATYANEGSFNNHWGVPLSLARLPADADFGVFEIGMNHAGELGPLSQMVQPDVALITNIEAVHLEFFASLNDIADAKAEIFQGVKTDGTVVLNRDNPYFGRLAASAKAHNLKNILSFGQDAKSNARLLAYTAVPEGGVVKADINGRILEYRIGTPGQHLAFNSLGALLAAVTAGGDLEACASALAHYSQPKGRGVFQTISLAGGALTLIDESYNASPVAVRAAIHVLAQMSASASPGRRIIVLGDMKELGATSAALHAELAKDLISNKIDLVFCCGEMMAHLYNALPESMRGGYAETSAALIPSVVSAVGAHDIVTIKGSHSMNMDNIVNALIALAETSQTSKRVS